MKKILLIAAVAGLSMVSCKKEYTCECKYTGVVTGTVSEKFDKMKKKDAEKKCDEYDESVAGQTAECSLK